MFKTDLIASSILLLKSKTRKFSRTSAHMGTYVLLKTFVKLTFLHILDKILIFGCERRSIMH